MPSSATAECSGSTALAPLWWPMSSAPVGGDKVWVFHAAWVGWDRRTSVIPVHTLLWHWCFCLFYCFVFLGFFTLFLAMPSLLPRVLILCVFCWEFQGMNRAVCHQKTGSSLLLHVLCEENPDPVPSTLNQPFSSSESSRKQLEPSFPFLGCLVEEKSGLYPSALALPNL